MARTSSYALALLTALSVSSAAYASTAHRGSSFQGAHASVAKTSETDVRQQCVEQARARWGTNSQDMQTPRDFAYRTCMYDHGIQNP